ncbi:putative membrane protein [Mycobacterium xenopi 4042]|uniref:Putative membrane protein n=1 Tax=Mycobacterium xenopi 4042 TaxID=1299334 RepID=X8AG40_MYCXE|nr:putative membrane protein [Mycobacterium xenopi 4042]
MHTAYLVLTLIAIAVNGFSGVSALVHFAPIIPGMQAAGVPCRG